MNGQLQVVREEVLLQQYMLKHHPPLLVMYCNSWNQCRCWSKMMIMVPAATVGSVHWEMLHSTISFTTLLDQLYALGSVPEVVRGWMYDRVALTAAEVIKYFTTNTGSPSKLTIEEHRKERHILRKMVRRESLMTMEKALQY